MSYIPGSETDKEDMTMCPELKENVCAIAGVEPLFISCVDGNRCSGGQWDMCRVYITQFSLAGNKTLAAAN